MKKHFYLPPETDTILIEAEACVCTSATINSYEDGGDVILYN